MQCICCRKPRPRPRPQPRRHQNRRYPPPPSVSLAPDKQDREPDCSGTAAIVRVPSCPFPSFFCEAWGALPGLVTTGRWPRGGRHPASLNPPTTPPPFQHPGHWCEVFTSWSYSRAGLFYSFSLHLHDSSNRVTTYGNDPDDRHDRRTSTPGCQVTRPPRPNKDW